MPARLPGPAAAQKGERPEDTKIPTKKCVFHVLARGLCSTDLAFHAAGCGSRCPYCEIRFAKGEIYNKHVQDCTSNPANATTSNALRRQNQLARGQVGRVNSNAGSTMHGGVPPSYARPFF